ncbi:prepilin-type N-terminal cleavage/methylation domain-containing protein [Hafnia alvei]|uniref:Prepilin peptidase dependent protein A n=2 Tax=Hafnia alvei TaxID=569 RepID=A0A1C6Z3W9_HAFAL|nr:prepilin-type N-terminal cleavage/methylation domain-containing protein [Hafnia alvei]SCM53876.1 prepilin peptidase dependent protein A [Hafnia alvei]
MEWSRMSGFTLLEMMVVMLLVSSMALYGLHGFRQQHMALQLEQAGLALLTFLQQAQRRAFAENSTVQIEVNAEQRSVGIQNTSRKYLPSSPDIAVASQLTKNSGFYGVRNNALAGHIDLSNLAGTVSIIWSAQGRLRLCAQPQRLLGIPSCN